MRSAPLHAKPSSFAPYRAIAVALAVLLATAGVFAGARTVLAAGQEEGQSASAGDGSAETQNATAKSEVVYANLTAAGAVQDVYVVNVLDPDDPGTVTDFGTYTAVQNLTDAESVAQNGNAVTVEIVGDTLSYQGDMGAAALPWNIAVSYSLDGASVDPADLGGATGALSIDIATEQNQAVDAAYFENYLLQVSVSLPQSAVHNVTAPDGQIAMAGSDTQVTFMAMPGKDGSFTVQAQVENFQMPGISFAAVPLAMGIDSPDTSELVSGFEQLGSGVGELSSGAGSLALGAGEFAGGAGQLASGASGVAEGAGSLAGGVGQLASGAAGLASGLAQYQQALEANAADAQGKVAGDPEELLRQAATAYSSAYSEAYNAAFVPAYLQAISESKSEQEAAGIAASTAANAAAADAGVQAALAAFGLASQAAGYVATAQSLSAAAVGLGSTEDASSLLGGAASLSGGLSGVSDGASDLASGAGVLASGTAATAQGASSLASGASELAGGTDTLYTEVQAMPAAVQEEIDKMMAEYDKSDFVPPSFTSPKNTNVKLVQFVLTTEPIEAPEEPIAEEPQAEESIIDRFFALFQ